MIELQTMPLRFRVWCNSKNDFITLEDVFFPQKISKDKQNEKELCLRWFAKYIASVTDFGSLDEEEYIISQDTGLKDKNGKDIYTGDILAWKHYCNCEEVKQNNYIIKGIVEYAKCGEIIMHTAHIEGQQYFIPIGDILRDIEIVGNICQNPELLEKNR